jgi:hypothetical protein
MRLREGATGWRGREVDRMFLPQSVYVVKRGDLNFMALSNEFMHVFFCIIFFSLSLYNIEKKCEQSATLLSQLCEAISIEVAEIASIAASVKQ